VESLVVLSPPIRGEVLGRTGIFLLGGSALIYAISLRLDSGSPLQAEGRFSFPRFPPGLSRRGLPFSHWSNRARLPHLPPSLFVVNSFVLRFCRGTPRGSLPPVECFSFLNIGPSREIRGLWFFPPHSLWFPFRALCLGPRFRPTFPGGKGSSGGGTTHDLFPLRLSSHKKPVFSGHGATTVTVGPFPPHKFFPCTLDHLASDEFLRVNFSDRVPPQLDPRTTPPLENFSFSENTRKILLLISSFNVFDQFTSNHVDSLPRISPFPPFSKNVKLALLLSERNWNQDRSAMSRGPSFPPNPPPRIQINSTLVLRL